MEFQCLGPFEARVDGVPVDLGEPQRRLVLALLLAHANSVVSTDRLVDSIWGDEPPESGRKIVQGYVSGLRKTLGEGDIIESRSPGYRLNVKPEQVDALFFEEGAAEGASEVTSDPQHARQLLREALSLWQGSPYEDLADYEALRPEITRLEQLRLTTLENQLAADIYSGAAGSVVDELADLTDRHPLRERLWSLRMLALYRSGRQSEALRAYQRLRRVLGEELGIEPSPEVQELESRILRHDPTLEPAGTVPSIRTNLRPPLTSFVGRIEELAEVAELLVTSRLVTLTGPAGSGKTRLALEVAQGQVDLFPDGVWFVDLAPLTSSDQVADAIAAPLGLSGQAERPTEAVLNDYVAGRRLQLVLDNCEHLVGKVAHLVAELLQTGPNLTLLATSRERLGIAGEVTYEVPPLPFPEANEALDIEAFDAVRLFVERARAADPHFDLAGANSAAVADICRRLDGMPLALELAAARVRMFEPETLLARLSDSLKTLTGGARNLPGRQQTIRNTIEWSYDLLDDDEQALFARLAVFQGGRTIEAAEAVCGPALAIDLLDGLESLLDKSLLRRERGPEGESRFVMLETIHAYASERLVEGDEADELHKRHAEYFAAVAEQASTELTGHDQGLWMRQLTLDYENLRKAINWTLGGGDVQTGLRLVGALGEYWRYKSWLQEGQRWLRHALDLADQAPKSVHGQLLTWAGFMANALGDPAEGRRLYEEALIIERKLNNQSQIAQILISLGLCSSNVSGISLETSEEGLALARQIGDKSEIAHGLNVLGEIHRMQGDYAAAKQVYEEALPITREIGHRLREAMIIANLGMVMFNLGDFEQARSRFLEAYKLGVETGDHYIIADGLAFGGVLGALGEPERATRLLAAGDTQLAAIGSRRQPRDQFEVDKLIALVRDQLDDETFDRLWAEGASMSLEDALELALCEDSPNPRREP